MKSTWKIFARSVSVAWVKYQEPSYFAQKLTKIALGIVDTLKGSELQYSGTRRIYSLFKRATIRFTGDLSLWLQYIDYAKRNQSNKVLSGVFVE
jgi:hypothetical protein